MEVKIGKICKVSFGKGGYDEAMFGLTVELGSNGWGVSHFNGTWSSPPSKGARWTVDDQRSIFADVCLNIIEILREAKVSDVSKLAGIPIEATFDRGTLVSWRVLTEVI